MRPSATTATVSFSFPLLFCHRSTWREIIWTSPEMSTLRCFLAEHDLSTVRLVPAARAPGLHAIGDDLIWDLTCIGTALSKIPLLILFTHRRAWVASSLWLPACPTPSMVRTFFLFVFIIVTGGSLSNRISPLINTIGVSIMRLPAMRGLILVGSFFPPG